MGKAVVDRAVAAGRRVLWLTHTQALRDQTHRRLGGGLIASGCPRNARHPFQVAMIQTLLEREFWEPFDVLVFDECHHIAGSTWGELVRRWPGALLLGLTATPQRGDGRSLQPFFDDLVVAAQYSELTRLGHLAPLRLRRPDRELDKGLALDVLEAYQKHGEGRSGFVYLRSISEARDAAVRFTLAGVPSECIDESTPDDVREAAFAKLRTGELRLLTNVYTLTEGVDVPSASVSIFGRGFGHESTMLQAAGRVLRPHTGKLDALILDLPGCTHRLGIPTADREYTLGGTGIKALPSLSLRVCLSCGFVWETGAKCPRCGWAHVDTSEKRPLRIYNAELREVYAGSSTPDWAKKAEWERLQQLCREKSIDDYFAVKQYKELFNESPPRDLRPDVDRHRAEYQKLLSAATRAGYKPGRAAFQFQARYGYLPPRTWGTT
jgi:hypothetical protein